MAGGRGGERREECNNCPNRQTRHPKEEVDLNVGTNVHFVKHAVASSKVVDPSPSLSDKQAGRHI